MSKLNIFDAWKNGVSSFFAPKSAQGYTQLAMATAGACGSSCGAGDEKKKPEEKPSACGSACGAGDEKKPEEKPSACGSACGAADDGKKEEKPAACGASCGAGDKK